MVRFIFLAAILSFAAGAGSQTHIAFGESQKMLVDGVEFSYILQEESSGNNDSSQVSSLRIAWHAVNTDRFSKIFMLADYDKLRNEEPSLAKQICLGKLFIASCVQDKFVLITDRPNTSVTVLRKRNFLRKRKITAYDFRPGATLSGFITVNVAGNAKPVLSPQPFLSPIY